MNDIFYTTILEGIEILDYLFNVSFIEINATLKNQHSARNSFRNRKCHIYI